MGKLVFSLNPIVLKNYHKSPKPFAPAIYEAFNQMLQEIIPKDVIITPQFQSWINEKRNELMQDIRINGNEYFSKEVSETGEVRKRSDDEMAQLKLELLKRELSLIRSAFVTFMKNPNNPAFLNANNIEAIGWFLYYQDMAEKYEKLLQSNEAQQ